MSQILNSTKKQVRIEIRKLTVKSVPQKTQDIPSWL